jgi:uncharacterized protein (DUF1501 family)
MDTLTRRKFLKMTGAGAIASTSSLLTLEDIARASIDNPLPLGTPIVVIVTLYGGNDGLNTVVPWNDSTYKSMRPGISLKDSEVIPLSDGLALNGSMTGFKSLWDQNRLAIVRGVGYPTPDRSHFSSMSIWQTGSPKEHLSSGWIGRWLDTQPHDPMTAIGLGSILPPLLAGVKQVGSVLPLGGLVIPKGSLATDCLRLASPSSTDSPLMVSAASSMRDLFNISGNIAPVLKNQAPPADVLPTQAGSNFGGDSSLSQQLDIVAKLIAASAPTRVWAVSLGGFDTHADEIKGQTLLLKSVSDSVSKFLSQIRGTTRANDVTVLIYSEFGRRVQANASFGTDHGTSGPVFLAGNKVTGGFYGDQPSLTKLTNEDLAVTTDFRDVYANVLEDLLATPADRVLSGWKSKLGIIKKI